MANATFRAPRIHNRKFPGKLGKRPDRAVERKVRALNRHRDSLNKWSASNPKSDSSQDRIVRIDRCVTGTLANLTKLGVTL